MDNWKVTKINQGIKMTRVEGQEIVIRELNIIEKLVYKIKQFLNDRYYAFIDDEQELARYMKEQGIWNNPKDKSYWNRIDFDSHEGLDIKRLCRKLDLMLEK